jgi:hypothetical protein
MADPVTDAVLVSAVIGAGASVYSASQAGKSIPKPVMPNTPKAPETKPAAASLEQGEIAAKTAGGTILSKPGAVGDGANAVRKTLLGP